jgi:hypothetical protein
MATLIPICIIGGLVVDTNDINPNEIGNAFEQTTRKEEVLKKLEEFTIELNKKFGENYEGKYAISFIPSIFPIKDKEYADVVKEFIDGLAEAVKESN